MKLKKINQLIIASALSTSFVGIAVAAPAVEFSGTVEASITQENATAPAKDTQFTVGKVELSVAGNVNETISAEVVLLAENFGVEGEDNSFAVDTALIHMNTVAGTLSVGKTEFGFTAGESNMITDPVSDEGAVAGFGISLSGEAGILGYSVYLADPEGDNHLNVGFGDLKGLTLSIIPVENITLSAGYVSHNNGTITSDSTTVAAIAEFAGFGFIAEMTDIDEVGRDASTNFEVSYGFDFGTLAGAIQEDGAGNDWHLLSFGMEIYENTGLTFEYKDNTTTTASDEVFTLQLAYSF